MPSTRTLADNARHLWKTIDGTRRTLAHTFHVWSGKTWPEATPWDVRLFGRAGVALLSRERDNAHDRLAAIRGYAEHAVWRTHFMGDALEAGRFKESMLKDNSHSISVQELDAFLAAHIDELPFHNAGAERRAQMIADTRRQLQPTADMPVPSTP